jgi:uncharacterized protein (TIGR03086 family)
MSEIATRYEAVAHGFTIRVEGVGPGGWSALTPCSDWSAQDLVAHVIMTHRRVMATLDEADPVEADLQGDLGSQWLGATGAVVEALGHQDRASKLMSGMFGDQTFASLVGRLVCADTLIHTWDLARATGQDENLDPDAVEKALEALTPIDDGLRRPGGFAAKIVPPAGADLQTQLLNFCGRAP